MEKFGLSINIINDIVTIIKKYEEVECVKIYGSRAREDYKETSDIDIALFGNDLTHTINTKIYFELDGLYIPYKFDVVNFNSLSDNNELRNNILKEGVDIYVKQNK